ncbi:hypothetical protein QQX09_01865 [Demequina sp. SYSU T00192]|uniref:Uncharacterized protein n=1 Tax=Demequina litoralis TaxID=3051660 RepID=A0ABT8G646_9MICO|nr:hypothetical protein [Demequina sp. SYSU T00192]MDN4474593.1 hypothetical protein [Demequina sp. SYSU T00192]
MTATLASIHAGPSIHRTVVRVAPPVGARFPRRHLPPATAERLTRTRAVPARPIGARFPRLSPEQRSELRLVEVPSSGTPHRAVGARFPRA